MKIEALAALAAACALGAVPASAAEDKPQFFMSNPNAPFSQAVQVGDLLFMSGVISPSRESFAAEAKGVMDGVGAVLTSRGLAWTDVVKCTVMIADMAKWEEFNGVYASYFGSNPKPARSAFGASGLARGAQVELECIAHVPSKK